MKNIRTIFMGTPEFAVDTLTALIDDGRYDIVGVFTAPDRPAGRGQEVKMSAVKQLAIYEKLAVYQPERIRADEWVRKIAELAADLIVVAAYGQIIPQAILDLPKYGCINVHASLLPKYRGASPIHYALLNGEQKTGVTIMKMDAGMDTGPMIAQKEIKIDRNDSLPSLHDKLSILGADLLLEVLPDYLTGKSKPAAQADELASYTKILKKEDGRIDWHQSSQQILNKIRAFNPWPGTFTEWEGKCLKIIEAIEAERHLDSGNVSYQDNRIFIGTGNGSIEITKLQLEGRTCLIAPEFVRGCSMLDGYYCQ